MKSNIQEQLRARRLKPSENSWDVLEKRLELEEQNSSSKKRVLWFAAASIAAVVVISLSVFRSNVSDPVVPKENTVEVEEQLTNPDSNPIQNNETNESEMIAMPVEMEVEEDEVTSEAKNSQERFAQRVELNNEEIKASVGENELAGRLAMEQPVVTVKEGVSNLDHTTVSDADLDALLKDAEVSMAMRKQKEIRKADADWLLMEVEMELDQNFKDKVFDVIRNAVSNPKNTITRRDN